MFHCLIHTHVSEKQTMGKRRIDHQSDVWQQDINQLAVPSV